MAQTRKKPQKKRSPSTKRPLRRWWPILAATIGGIALGAVVVTVFPSHRQIHPVMVAGHQAATPGPSVASHPAPPPAATPSRQIAEEEMDYDEETAHPPQMASLPPAHAPIEPPAAAPPVAMPPTASVPVPPVPGDTLPWLRHAVPARPYEGKPLIAVVIDDMGLDRPRSAAAIALPAPLTMSFMTYAQDLQQQTAAARAHGHELMVHIPMEPVGSRIDPGPNALKIGQDTAEIRRLMEWDLTRFDGFVGINNHMGSRFTASSDGMVPVIEAVRAHGVFFLDSRTTAQTVGASLAQSMGVPHAQRDVFLDDGITQAGVTEQIAVLETIARRQGAAIAIGHPRDATLAVLARWLPTAEARGFQLVPVSTIVRRNQTLAAKAPHPAG
ncbi:MAG TPA: divergent polysaccharide deacetylase family protein [Stellaceae bacterium]|nr:divergent polysaccharide deacetylase family protein [Stellaceae bacterium]